MKLREAANLAKARNIHLVAGIKTATGWHNPVLSIEDSLYGNEATAEVNIHDTGTAIFVTFA